MAAAEDLARPEPFALAGMRSIDLRRRADADRDPTLLGARGPTIGRPRSRPSTTWTISTCPTSWRPAPRPSSPPSRDGSRPGPVPTRGPTQVIDLTDGTGVPRWSTGPTVRSTTWPPAAVAGSSGCRPGAPAASAAGGGPAGTVAPAGAAGAGLAAFLVAAAVGSRGGSRPRLWSIDLRRTAHHAPTCPTVVGLDVRQRPVAWRRHGWLEVEAERHTRQDGTKSPGRCSRGHPPIGRHRAGRGEASGAAGRLGRLHHRRRAAPTWRNQPSLVASEAAASRPPGLQGRRPSQSYDETVPANAVIGLAPGTPSAAGQGQQGQARGVEGARAPDHPRRPGRASTRRPRRSPS